MSLAIALSVAIGLSLGLLGGGGSILAVPVLIHVVGLAAKPAIATSLLVVAAASFAAMAVHARAGRVRYRVGATFGATSMVGAFAGGHLSRFLPDGILLAAFTVVMLVTGVMMLRRRREVGAARCASARCTSVLGVSVGLVTGVVGAGGGFVVVPALAILGGLPMPEAIATSLLVIGVNSLTGFLGQIGHVAIDARIAREVTLAAIAGSFVGALGASRLRPESLRRGFGVLVLAMAGVMAYGQIHEQVARPGNGGS